jgi:adenylate cyclase
MQLVYETDGQEKVITLEREEYALGRSSENDVVLNDFSVSRRHARLKKEKDNWVMYDLGSTNGIKIGDRLVPQTIVQSGDVLTIGTYTISFREDPILRPPGPRVTDSSSATFLRSLADFNEDFNLEKPGGASVLRTDSTIHRKRDLLDVAYKNKIFEILVQVAKTLIVAEKLNDVLEKVMDIVFEYLPVERAFILLADEQGQFVPRLSRSKKPTKDAVTELPISRTIIDQVVGHRVAVLTSDALTDDRFDGGQSIRIHQIRSAMCAPLWSRDTIIGVIHVDSPLHVGSFKAEDLDLLTALANFAAVAIERTRLGERVEREKKIRNRLERYHSPSVVEEITASATAVEERVEEVRVREVSILFADVCGFTTMAESMEPADVAGMLRTIFQFAVDGIFAEGGTLDKFIGDAVMAFFGAPIPVEDHALRAVRAGLHLRDQMRRWNEARERAGERRIEVRIGINSGRVMVGDIGPERRVDYTVLGNAVNIASRIEEQVAPPGELVIAQPTYVQVKGRIRADYMGDFPLKGLQAKIPVYRVDAVI